MTLAVCETGSVHAEDGCVTVYSFSEEFQKSELLGEESGSKLGDPLARFSSPPQPRPHRVAGETCKIKIYTYIRLPRAVLSLSFPLNSLIEIEFSRDDGDSGRMCQWL